MVLGSGFSVRVGSAITRCSENLGSHDHTGGVFTDQRATYCLNGMPLQETNVYGEYATYVHQNQKVTYSGSYSRPNGWRVQDGAGYIYNYEIIDNSTSDQNISWVIKTQEDVFGNKVTYYYNSENQIDNIEYSGLWVQFHYTDFDIGQVYSQGENRSIGKLISRIELKKSGQSLYDYTFRYEPFSGYQALPTKRLVAIKKCYNIGSPRCTNEMTFQYSKMQGELDSIYPSSDDTTTVIDVADIDGNSKFSTDKLVSPTYVKGNLNNRGSEEICFYSYQNKLVCAVSEEVGKYSFNQNASQSITVSSEDTDENSKYYAGTQFVDLNRDGYQDLCLPDESGIKCALNSKSLDSRHGAIFSDPYYASESLNYETSYQFIDINRDGYPDICGATSNLFYRCYENNKEGSFSSLYVLSVDGDFAADFESGLVRKQGESKYKFYKRISSVLMDFDGDQVPDLCHARRQEFVCYRGSYNSSHKLSINTSNLLMSYQLYQQVPDAINAMPEGSTDTYDQAGFDWSEYNRRAAAFDQIKEVNELITISMRYQDINSDGLIDICYVKNRKLYCSINDENQWLSAVVYVDFTNGFSEFSEYNLDRRKEIYSSLVFQDVNADGSVDACYVWNDQQKCSYNKLDSFTEFKTRIEITSDSQVVERRGHYFNNYMSARLGERVKYTARQGVDIYGPVFYMEDMNGDRRTELCLRTINGIDCHTNEQQSHYSLLTGVTDALGNQLEFEYKSLSQGGFYKTTSTRTDSVDPFFLKSTPVGLFLTSMRVDSGVDAPGSFFETISYEYNTYRFDPLTGQGGFDQVIQTTSAGLSNKKEITEYYQKRFFKGKVLSVTSYQNNRKIEFKKNAYRLVDNRGLKYIQLDQTWKYQYDPVSGGKVREEHNSFSSFDEYKFPQKVRKTQTAYTSSGEDTKYTETNTSYHHRSDKWILGKPAQQSVLHRLTGADDQIRTVSFEYYPDSMALKKQIMEPGSQYEKSIDYTYQSNGLAVTKSVTGYLNGHTRQTRTTGYLEYTSLGQPKKVKNSLGYETNTHYHNKCLAPEREYDSEGRLLVTHYFDNTCRVNRSEYLSGKIEFSSQEWSSEPSQHPDNAQHQNRIITKYSKWDNLGAHSDVYKDRAGRTIKEVSIVSKDDNHEQRRTMYFYYDRQGILVGKTLPIMSIEGNEIASELPQWSTSTYDEYFRPRSSTAIAPDGSTQTLSFYYEGLTTTETYIDRVTKKSVGVLGKVVHSSEYGKEITYGYTALGELAWTEQNGDSATRTAIGYDEFGFKTSHADPATGNWQYKINSFGELYYKKDANGRETHINYDIAGRKISSRTLEGTSHWTYFDTGNGKGQLNYTESPDGIKRSYQYDSKGRVSDEYMYASGIEINRTKHKYDQYGRVETLEYNKNATDSGMTTPIHANFDRANKLSHISIPVNKLKAFDYQTIQNQYESAMEQIVELNTLIRSIEGRMAYHADRFSYYSAKAQFYASRQKGLKSELEAAVGVIDTQIGKHQEKFDEYRKKYDELMRKSRDYGGLSADRHFEYQGYNSATGKYEFSYERCVKKIRRLWNVRCSRKESGYFDIDSSKFGNLPTNTYKTCRIMKSGSRYPVRLSGRSRFMKSSRNHPSHKGEYIGKEEIRTWVKAGRVRVGTGRLSRYENRPARWVVGTVYKFRSCKNVKLNPADIYTALAAKFKRLMEIESANIYALEEDKDEVASSNVMADVEVTKYKESWLPVAIDPILFVPAAVPYLAMEQKAMKRQDALAKYEYLAELYSGLAEEQTGLYTTASAELAPEYTESKELLAAKEAFLENIDGFMSLDTLENSAAKQEALAGQNLIVWAALSYDVSGKLRSELFGNGVRTKREINRATQQIEAIETGTFTGTTYSRMEYEYTEYGTLHSKVDSERGISEVFTHIDNQLINWSISVNGEHVEQRDYDYDSLGNIVQKGTNTYAYNDPYNPYRMTAFNGSTVIYDKNGYLTSANGNEYQWSSFGKALRIQKGSYSTTYKYDASQTRAVKTDAEGTTYYISPTYEQVHKSNGDILHRYNIRNGYETVATIERYEYVAEMVGGDPDNRPQDKVAYYSRDILGSGVIITGSLGQVIGERHYTPYGEEIDLWVNEDATATSIGDAGDEVTINVTDDVTELIRQMDVDATVADLIENHQEVLTNAESKLGVDAQLLGEVLTVTNADSMLKGFTGHEELPNIGIVNMNARLYDPVMARFVSPDSIVPDLSNPLAFNRYSYVYNNPALATDPTGHFVSIIGMGTGLFVSSHVYSDNAQLQTLTQAGIMIAAAAMAGPGASIATQALIAGGTSLAISASLSGRVGRAEIRSAAIAAATTVAMAKTANYIGHGNHGLFKETWQRAAAHGTAQGSIAIIRGKSFWTGFVSGSVGHVVGSQAAKLKIDSNSVMGRTLIASGAGALSAKATGGDAAYGAITAAMVHLFNAEQEKLTYIRSVHPDDEVPMENMVRSFQSAIANVDANCGVCQLKGFEWLRGIRIHTEFSAILSLSYGDSYLGQSYAYQDGERVNWLMPGSIRPDGGYGNPESPQFVVEIKTSNAIPSQNEMVKYENHMPKSTRTYFMIEDRYGE